MKKIVIILSVILSAVIIFSLNIDKEISSDISQKTVDEVEATQKISNRIQKSRGKVIDKKSEDELEREISMDLGGLFDGEQLTKETLSYALELIKGYIEKYPQHIDQLFGTLDDGFIFAVASNDKESALKMYQLIAKNFSPELENRCYEFYLQKIDGAKVSALRKTLISCKGKQDIQDTAMSYIELLASHDDQLHIIDSYLSLKKEIPNLVEVQKVFARNIIEEYQELKEAN